jgi:hypothetical protein
MDRIGDYTTAADPAPAGWVVAGLRGFAESVLSVVPAGLEAYARIFHPAQRRDGTHWTPVSWHQVAQANHRLAHPAMQWCHLVGSCSLGGGGQSQPGIWDLEPAEGSLPRDLAVVLAEMLAAHTATPERCWFGVWEGFGALAVPPDAAAFEIPGRRMLLLAGAVGAVATASLCTAPFWQSPNLWWPEDRAWCVATEIDLMSTYIGASRRCVQAIVEHAALEAAVVAPTDGITHFSDSVNPPPG